MWAPLSPTAWWHFNGAPIYSGEIVDRVRKRLPGCTNSADLLHHHGDYDRLELGTPPGRGVNIYAYPYICDGKDGAKGQLILAALSHLNFWTTVCKPVRPMLSVRCLSVCNVRALWPNGWTDQDETWRAGRPRPWPHCVKWGPRPPSPKRGRSHPQIFGPCLFQFSSVIFIVA